MTFRLPPYPYDRLAGLAKVAEAQRGGMVDCSIGTPYDPPLPAVIQALATSGAERGYPASAGSPALRGAAAELADASLRAGPASIRRQSPPASGPRSWSPLCHTCLGLRSPDKDTVLYPAVSYPTYAMGAELAGCRAVPVPSAPGRLGGSTSTPSTPSTPRGRCCSGRTRRRTRPGGLGDLAAEAAWGRAHGVPVFSDECYAVFTWDGPPRSVLQHGSDGVVAVHSLSKRSNLAGVRVGFYAGDPELVEFLRAVRQHAGLMVPGPAQAAGWPPWPTMTTSRPSGHATGSAWRFLAGVLGGYGCPVGLPEGGFYLWVPVPAGPLERRLGHGRGPGQPTAGCW